MSKIQIIGGNFQNASGTPVANGFLRMWLSHDAQNAVDPGEVAGALEIDVPLDVSGNIAGTVYVWSNNELNPSGTYYNVELYTSTGMKAWRSPQQWVIPDSPNPYIVGNQVPNLPPAS